MQRHGLKKIATRLIPGILACLILASCAPSFKTVMSRYQETPVCCKVYREFDYEKLAIPCSRSFWIDENSKAFDFDTGKSYFKAFELPKCPLPYSIIVKSYLLGLYFDSAYIFSPAVMLLDENYVVTRYMDRGVFHFTNAPPSEIFGTAAMGKMFEGEIPITSENINERYLVILTTDELMKEKTEHAVLDTIPLILPGFVTVIPTGRMHTYVIPHSPMGKLKVIVRAHQED